MHLKMLNRSTKKNLTATELRIMLKPSACKQTHSPLHYKRHWVLNHFSRTQLPFLYYSFRLPWPLNSNSLYQPVELVIKFPLSLSPLRYLGSYHRPQTCTQVCKPLHTTTAWLSLHYRARM